MTRRTAAPTPAQALTDFRFTTLGGEPLARLVYKLGVVGGGIITAIFAVLALAASVQGGGEQAAMGLFAAAWLVARYLFVVALLLVVLEVAVVVFDGRREREAASGER